MTEETLALSGAPEPIETPVEEVAVEAETPEVEAVEEEQKAVEASESPTDKDQSPKWATDRIDELTKNRREAEREAQYWREQAMNKQPEAPEPVEEKVKTLADFDYDETQFQAYLFEQSEIRAVEKAKQVLQQSQQEEAQKRKISEFSGREADFAKEVDDYNSVTRNPDLTVSQPMADVLTEMDDGPAVLYYLGKNPDVADSIANLPPLVAARELGRLEATLQGKKPEKEVSNAPAPAPKLKTGDPALTVSVDDMDQKAFNEHRRKFISNRGR